MKVIVESSNSINVNRLPENISGNYWIIDDSSKNLLNVVSENGTWVLKSNTEIKLCKSKEIDENDENNFLESVILNNNSFYYVLNTLTKEKYILYTLPGYENYENLIINYNQNNLITIGSGNNADIIVKNLLFGDIQLNIQYNGTGLFIKNLNENSKCL